MTIAYAGEGCKKINADICASIFELQDEQRKQWLVINQNDDLLQGKQPPGGEAQEPMQGQLINLGNKISELEHRIAFLECEGPCENPGEVVK